MLKNTSKIAFTLAELLITLTVIGVIAAITIPSLVYTIDDMKYREEWKKAFSDLSQATMLLLKDHGENAINLLVTPNLNDNFRDFYLTYINAVKSCDFPDSYGNCFPAIADIKFKNGDPIDASPLGTDTSGVISSSGYSISFYPYDDCNNPRGSYNVCGWIAVDVNALSPPNVIGRDIFAVWLLPDRIIPWGAKGDDRNDTCTSSTYGHSCSAEYLYQ